jgi:hypothetical protein
VNVRCGYPLHPAQTPNRCEFEASTRKALADHARTEHAFNPHQARVRARVMFDAAEIRAARTLAIDAGLDPAEPHTDAEVYRGIATRD